MKLNLEQQKAFDQIIKWSNTSSKEFRLGGYAGTGKTYLLQYLINHYDKPTVCCTPTGKAASVLMSKLNGKLVTTIHKLLYDPHEPDNRELLRLRSLLMDTSLDDEMRKRLEDRVQVEEIKLKENKVLFSLKENLGLNNELIIIDEASMVTTQMRADLIATNCKVLYVGDPGQLPPVKDEGWFVSGEFDAKLDTVQRQALESPIIRLSMEIRSGSVKRENYKDGDCAIISKEDLTNDHFITASQILTGRNTTRQFINRKLRRLWKFEGEHPVRGDKLICLKNETWNGTNFINGVQCEVIGDAVVNTFNFYDLDIYWEGEEIKKLPCYSYFTLSHYHKDLELMPRFNRRKYREFDYAYAITVHKSQGSEWDNVLLLDDRMNRADKIFRRKWLYTAVTRAKTKLVWAQ